MESELASRISAALGGAASSSRSSEYVTVEPSKVVEACKLVAAEGDFYHLTTITGVDDGESIGLLYHFWRGKEFLTVKTSVPKANPTLPSISADLPVAIFYEAEVMDMLGVVFEGNPMVGKKLLLPDVYPPEAPPPLRREADPEKIRRMMGLE